VPIDAIAKATLAAADERAPAAIGRRPGLAYKLTNAELRSRVVEITKDSYELGAEWLRAFDPGGSPVSPEDLVRVLMR
jgi:hypothetical protein